MSEYDSELFPKVAPPIFVHLDDFKSVNQLLSSIEYDELISESETPFYQSNLEQPRMSAKKVRLSYFIGDRGCIPLDEFVYTQNGLVQVKDVYDGMPILGGYVKSPHVFEDDVFEVEIMNNKFIATGEHPLWVKKSKKSKSKGIRNVRSLEQWRTIDEIKIFYDKRKNKESRYFVKRYDAKKFKFNTISIGKSFAKLLGYLMSDGYFSEKQSVKFTNVRKSLIEEVVELAMSLNLDLSPKYYNKGNGQDVLLTSKQGSNVNLLKTRLRELGIIDRKSFGKLMMLQEDELKEFIKGYFNGDGNLYPAKHPTITFYTGVNRQQVYEFQFMLWRLGVNGFIDYRLRDKGIQGCYEIEIGKKKYLDKLLDFLDDMKYPEKFVKAKHYLSLMGNSVNHEEDVDGEWVPITSVKKLGRKTVCGWQTEPSHEIISYDGLKTHNSGKTSAMEEDAELYYNEGLSCWWMWGSRSNENVFIAVNRNCRRRWKQKFDEIENAIVSANTIADRQKLYDVLNNLKNRLHCDCHHAYPINWLVPNYYDFKGVDEYNYNWSGKDEFDEAFENGWITRSFQDLSKDEKAKLIQRKLRKPKHLVKTDLIRICKFTVPNGAKDKEIFEKEFLKYALEARKEHRWLVMNPLMFLKEQDKFSTVGYIMERLKIWVDQYFQPNTPESVAKLRGISEPVPKDQWTKIELSWDKIHLILAEIRTIAPPHKYSPEQKSNLSKRPIIDMIPEMRHFRIWLNGDLQSPDDLNDSVRPMADYVVIKRSSPELLGDEWTYFFKNIENLRKNRLIAMSHGKFEDFKKAPSELKTIIDKSLPSIPEIPKNKGYVVYRNGEFYLESFGSASFHHKKETETLQSVTGITWKIKEEILEKNSKLPGSITESASNSEKRLKNYDVDRVTVWCAREFIITKSWEKTKENLLENLKNPDNPFKLAVTGIELMEPKVLSNKVRKNKELKDIIDFAKKHKEKPVEELIASLKL